MNDYYAQINYDDFYHQRTTLTLTQLSAHALAGWRRRPQEAVVLLNRADYLRWRRGEFYPGRPPVQP